MRCRYIFVVLASVVIPTYGKCNVTSNQAVLFGATCEFLCHCKVQEECDAESATCPSGCLDPWMGKACQQMDIARDKEVRHLDNQSPPYYANKAVDGDSTSCSRTNFSSAGASREFSPYLRVTMKEAVVIRRLTFRTTSFSLHYFDGGFNVTVENSTLEEKVLEDRSFYPHGIKLCYLHMPESNINQTFEVHCTERLVGNQVRIQMTNKTSQLVLCDVNIFGECPKNQCGEDCLVVCHCKEFTYQDKLTGTCSTGCAGRWTGQEDRCDKECSDQHWGTQCQHKCGHCRANTPCDVITGECEGSCEPGYHGTKCVDECTDGTYGQGCAENCSQHCKGGYSHCNHVDGECVDGCIAGWTEKGCEQECQDGLYGERCQGHCSQNCRDGTGYCNHVDGRCEHGCTDGWQENRCDRECDDGTFGQQCTGKCSDKCLGGFINCNHVNGRCDQGCEAGWKGAKCEDACQVGTYGHNCNATCGHCASDVACEKSSGSCPKGCVAGFQGPTCKQECSAGRYGANCVEECGHCLDDTVCNKTNGDCARGCKSGYSGQSCTQECNDGQWGFNCNMSCGSCAIHPCHKQTGHCSGSCKPGYLETALCTSVCPEGSHGMNCSESCGNCSVGTSCEPSNGACLKGCSPGFYGIHCKDVEPVGETGAMSAAAIAGGSGAALVVVVGALIVVVMLKRRKSGRKTPTSSTSSARKGGDLAEKLRKPDNIYENSASFSNAAGVGQKTEETREEQEEVGADENTNVYYNSINASLPETAIRLSNLKEYILARCKTSKLVDEFKSIPYGLQYSTSVARRPHNISKNRYKDMYPYDHSRVVLDEIPGQPGTDYINASYIDGYNRSKAYIAAQGPTDKNVADFWRMVWQTGVKTIVMVTNPVEKGKMKCIEYWNSDKTGDISITTTSEETLAEMIIRTLHVQKACSNKGRTVVQFHYTGWPDKATPDGATGLVNFLQKCRRNFIDRKLPVVVHCSAGVGRTGTFIAMDILYEQGKDLGYIDVYETVKTLRTQRLNTVQTKGQYVFLHEAAYEALVLPLPITAQQFTQEYYKLIEVKQSGQTKLAVQFKQIGDEFLSREMRNDLDDIPNSEGESAVAKHAENRRKNRFDNILAATTYRPFLSTSVEGCNDYINAVYMQSYRASHTFLLSQAPLAHTAVDCCRLIYERSIQLVVTFDNDQLAKDEIYLPEKGTLTIGPFNIKNLSEEKRSGYVIRRHKLAYKGKDTDICQAIYTDWKADKSIPAEASSFLGLLEEVKDLQRLSNNPVLIQCLNGAEKSGLLAIMLHVLERLVMEGDVAILQTVRQMRGRRNQIMPTYDQYKFCHDLVFLHLDRHNTYANT